MYILTYPLLWYLLTHFPAKLVSGYSTCDVIDIFFLIDTSSIRSDSEGVINLINSVIQSGSSEESGFSVIVYGDNVPNFNGKKGNSVLCEIDETAAVYRRESQIERMNAILHTAFNQIISSVDNETMSDVTINEALRLAQHEAKMDERLHQNRQRGERRRSQSNAWYAAGLNEDEDVFVVFDYHNELETSSKIYPLYHQYAANEDQSIHFVLGEELQIQQQARNHHHNIHSIHAMPATQRITVSDPAVLALMTHFFVFDELIDDIGDDTVHSKWDQFLDLTCPANIQLDENRTQTMGLSNHIQLLEPETLVDCIFVYKDTDETDLIANQSFMIFYDYLDDGSTATFNEGDYIILEEEDLLNATKNAECIKFPILKLVELVDTESDADNNRNILTFNVNEPQSFMDYITFANFDSDELEEAEQSRRRGIDWSKDLVPEDMREIRPDNCPVDETKTWSAADYDGTFGPNGCYSITTGTDITLNYGADFKMEFKLGISAYGNLDWCTYCFVCPPLPCGASFGFKTEGRAGYKLSAKIRLEFESSIEVKIPKLLYKAKPKTVTIGGIPVHYKPWVRVDVKVKTEPIYAFAELLCEFGHSIAVGYEWRSDGNGRNDYLTGPDAKANECGFDWGVSNDEDHGTALDHIGVTTTITASIGINLYELLSAQFIAEFVAPLMVYFKSDGCTNWEGCSTSMKYGVISFRVDMNLYFRFVFNSAKVDEVIVGLLASVASTLVGFLGIDEDLSDTFEVLGEDAACLNLGSFNGIDTTNAIPIWDTNIYTMDPFCENMADLFPSIVPNPVTGNTESLLDLYCNDSCTDPAYHDWVYANNCDKFLTYHMYPLCRQYGSACVESTSTSNGITTIWSKYGIGEIYRLPYDNYDKVACFFASDYKQGRLNMLDHYVAHQRMIADHGWHRYSCNTEMEMKDIVCEWNDFSCATSISCDDYLHIYLSGYIDEWAKYNGYWTYTGLHDNRPYYKKGTSGGTSLYLFHSSVWSNYHLYTSLDDHGAEAYCSSSDILQCTAGRWYYHHSIAGWTESVASIEGCIKTHWSGNLYNNYYFFLNKMDITFPSGIYFRTDGECYEFESSVSMSVSHYIGKLYQADYDNWWATGEGLSEDDIRISDDAWYGMIAPSIELDTVKRVDCDDPDKASYVDKGDYPRVRFRQKRGFPSYSVESSAKADPMNEEYRIYFDAVGDPGDGSGYIPYVYIDAFKSYYNYRNFYDSSTGSFSAGVYHDGSTCWKLSKHLKTSETTLSAHWALNKNDLRLQPIDCWTGFYTNVLVNGLCFRQIRDCVHENDETCLLNPLQFIAFAATIEEEIVYEHIHCQSESTYTYSSTPVTIMNSQDEYGNTVTQTATECTRWDVSASSYVVVHCDTLERIIDYDCAWSWDSSTSTGSYSGCCYDSPHSSTTTICDAGIYFKTQDECYVNHEECSIDRATSCGANNINCQTCMNYPAKDPNIDKISCTTGDRVVNFIYPECSPDCLTDEGGCVEATGGVDCHPIKNKIYDTGNNRCFLKKDAFGGWGCLEQVYNLGDTCADILQRVDCDNVNLKFDYIYPECWNDPILSMDGQCLTNYGGCPSNLNDGYCHPKIGKIYYVDEEYCVRPESNAWGWLDAKNYLREDAVGIVTLVSCETHCDLTGYYITNAGCSLDVGLGAVSSSGGVEDHSMDSGELDVFWNCDNAESSMWNWESSNGKLYTDYEYITETESSTTSEDGNAMLSGFTYSTRLFVNGEYTYTGINDGYPYYTKDNFYLYKLSASSLYLVGPTLDVNAAYVYAWLSTMGDWSTATWYYHDGTQWQEDSAVSISVSSGGGSSTTTVSIDITRYYLEYDGNFGDGFAIDSISETNAKVDPSGGDSIHKVTYEYGVKIESPYDEHWLFGTQYVVLTNDFNEYEYQRPDETVVNGHEAKWTSSYNERYAEWNSVELVPAFACPIDSGSGSTIPVPKIDIPTNVPQTHNHYFSFILNDQWVLQIIFVSLLILLVFNIKYWMKRMQSMHAQKLKVDFLSSNE
eukprot:1076321_1